MPAQPISSGVLAWRKSRASGADGGCVEVADRGTSVLVRDSRDRETVLLFSSAEWSAFLRWVGNEDGKGRARSA